ncbi:MAG: LrgB family protein, partial [Candidatus Eremiobacteraeota bacterium]|nr:LrgB family protein [Candidatus Eremiobacteraeota bacterium]
PHPLTTPVLFSTAIIVAVLLIAHVSLQTYAPAKDTIAFFLGPATVALALPLYRNRVAFTRELIPALGGLVAGGLLTMIVALVSARLFGLDHALQATFAVKSITAAVAVDVARIVHGDPSLAAGFVVCTGMIGAAIGPFILDKAGVRTPIARGISLGTISHGQGTAQAASESELSGAVAGVAMGLGAVLTSLAAPLVVPLIAR